MDFEHKHRGITCIITNDVTDRPFWIIKDTWGNLRFPDMTDDTVPTNRLCEILIELGGLPANHLWNAEHLYDYYLRYCSEGSD